MRKARFIIVDDDQSLLRVAEYHLKEVGYEIQAFTNAKKALDYHKSTPAQVIFTDLKMPEMDGIEFIHSIREFDQDCVIVMITGHPTIDAAVEAMKSGAFDFVQKPVEKDRLIAVAQKALEHYNLRHENRRLKALLEDHLDFGNMVGNSAAIREVYRQARQVSSSNTTILILGDTGTGKELLAKAIHQNSHRKDNPFVAVNCAAVPSTLLESELFGHVKGAFTGAVVDRKGLIQEATGGTVFLDEIGDLPLDLQPKLLRVLQEKDIQPVGANKSLKVDVRFITATHRDLKKMVEENTFRQDLYFRLNVIPIVLPLVTERQEDILPLFRHFLKEAALNEQKPVPDIEKEVVLRLEAHSWPGNVREIQNLAQRLMALSTAEEIKVSDLPDPFVSKEEKPASPWILPEECLDLEEWTDRLILSALEKNNWNQSKTAKYLNISRNTLVYRIDKRPLLKQAKQRVSG